MYTEAQDKLEELLASYVDGEPLEEKLYETEMNNMVITKGDLLDQQAKLVRSRFGHYFQHVEVVSDKSRTTYEALLAKYGLEPRDFSMVGNSLKSDILPVLALGGQALPKLISIVLLVFLIAAQCQPANQPTAQPAQLTTPSPPPLLIAPIQPGDGSDLIDRLLERGFIRVGIRVWPGAEYSPPAFRGFSNATIGGALNGFEVDVAHQIADGLGLELELVEAYPPVIASGEWQGEWDIALASLSPLDQSPEIVAFSIPYGYMPMGVLIPAGENNIQSFNDLSNKRVGVLEHSAYQRLLSPEGPSLTVAEQPLLFPIPANVQPVPLSNLLKAIRQMGQPDSEQVAQIDAIFGPAPILQEAVKSDLPVKLVPQAQNVGFQPLAIAVVPPDGLKVDRLLAEVDEILARLQRQGTLAEIYLRWYEQDLSQISNQ